MRIPGSRALTTSTSATSSGLQPRHDQKGHTLMRSRYTNNWTPTVRPVWYILVPAATLLILLLGGVL